MTELGWYFLAAPGPVRQTLFREAIMKLRLFQIFRARLEAQPDGRITADTVLEELAALLPYDQPSFKPGRAKYQRGIRWIAVANRFEAYASYGNRFGMSSDGWSAIIGSRIETPAFLP